MSEVSTDKKLKGKDLITIGIFSAIYFVINFAFMLLGGIHPVLWMLMPGFIAVFAGIPFMLMVAKVQKPGAVFLMGLITALIYFATGQFTLVILISMASTCILAEVVRMVCAWQALQGQMSISVFLMFVLFSFVLFGSVENINDAAHTLGVIDSAMNKLEALENVNYIDQDGTDIKPATYDIEFRDVSFGYDSRIVLHDLNFKIPQNSTTAIVGPSGSGKSTLCNLIARFYDVNSGTITIGGTDIRRFTCDSLLKNISMVFQNVYLFRDTIKNNIKFGSPDATDEQIVAAAKAARCHDFIMALPDGYDTVIGEGGSSLSGGEKQRISIARAMLKDAPIIILDEATASIDPENEHLIQEAISALTHGKTIITIAHRLATIENADQILVIDGGTVAQRGTHKELLQQEGTYKKFIQIREQAEGWRIQ